MSRLDIGLCANNVTHTCLTISSQNISLMSIYILLFFLVDDGAVLDVMFEKFYHAAPSGFDPIMIEQSLL